MILSIVGTVSLVGAVLITLGLGMATGFFTAAPLRGPDTMGYAMVFLMLAVRWGLVLVAILLCLAEGKFGWVSSRLGFAALIVIAVHGGIGLVATAAWGQWTGRAEWFTAPAGNLGAIVLPLAVQGLLLGLLWSKPEAVSGAIWARVLGWPMAALAVVGLCGGAVVLVRSQIESARRQRASLVAEQDARAENERENRAREERQAGELAALPDDAGLDEFVTHLFIDKTEAHHAAALKRIDGLPGLGDRIAESLKNPDPLKREYILNYVRMCGSPDPAWGASVAASMDTLAADIREAPALYDAATQRSYRGMVLGTLMTARRFEGREFGVQVRGIREALMTKEDDEVRRRALDLLDRFETGRPLNDQD